LDCLGFRITHFNSHACLACVCVLMSSALGGFGDRALAAPPDGSRFVYLDERDPYYPQAGSPKLTTPMWVGEPGVDAVILLSVDDMGRPAAQSRSDVSPEEFERFLTPLIQRLQRIDGRAPIAIMTCQTHPNSPTVQRLLELGLSLECHSYSHRFPFFRIDPGDDPSEALEISQQDYLACLENLFEVPGNRSVAYRMPGCDAQNTNSPRFYSEVFPLRTSKGRFLACDSSVMTWFPSNDETLPHSWRYDSEGRERFGKYPYRIPQTKHFMNHITAYPFPYPINNTIWELPVMIPCDSHGVHQNRRNSDKTVDDWKRAVDICVRKQGLCTLLFHTIGYIENNQVLEVIDYADRTYGSRVKFLNCREIYDRLTDNVLGGVPLRSNNGGGNGVRLLDVNGDGYLDAVIGNSQRQQTRIWQPDRETWRTLAFPTALINAENTGHAKSSGVRFYATGPVNRAGFAYANPTGRGGWEFDGNDWQKAKIPIPEQLAGQPLYTAINGVDRGVRFRDLNGDGASDLIVNNDAQNAVFLRNADQGRWEQASFGLPQAGCLVDSAGDDQGLRFVDLDADGDDDLVFSNGHDSWVSLFEDPRVGWSKRIVHGKFAGPVALPPIVKDRKLNGVWFHSGAMILENEHTTKNKDFIVRIPFDEILKDGGE